MDKTKQKNSTKRTLPVKPHMRHRRDKLSNAAQPEPADPDKETRSTRLPVANGAEWNAALRGPPATAATRAGSAPRGGRPAGSGGGWPRAPPPLLWEPNRRGRRWEGSWGQRKCRPMHGAGAFLTSDGSGDTFWFWCVPIGSARRLVLGSGWV